MDNTYISFYFWNNSLPSKKNTNPGVQETLTSILAGENGTMHLTSLSLGLSFWKWRKSYLSNRVKGLRIRIKMTMYAKHLWLCQSIVDRAGGGEIHDKPGISYLVRPKLRKCSKKDESCWKSTDVNLPVASWSNWNNKINNSAGLEPIKWISMSSYWHKSII